MYPAHVLAASPGGAALVAPCVALATTAAGALLCADAFSGLFHWATDNYGDGRTPALGTVIAAFQGHHLAPWTIKHRPFANNVHKICAAVLPLVLFAAAPSLLGGGGGLSLFFWTLFLNAQWASQEFHKV